MGKERVNFLTIIGAGITGAILSTELDSECYDKANFPGGRASTSRTETGLPGFDKGASVIHESLDYMYKSEKIKFYSRNFFSSYNIKKISPLRGFTDKLYSELGMNYIVKKILKTENVYLNERLNKVTKNYDSLFELHFDSGLQVTTEKLIITIPLPQAIEVLDENHFLEWIQFSKPHSEYRPCLVIVGKWRNTPDYIFDALSKLPKFTFLDPGHDLEYISIESEKFKDGHNLCVMIQLGENFSKKHLENWIEPNKFPTDFAVNSSTELFNNFFKLYDIPVNTEADFLRVHKWKYSQPINPLFENLDYMDFDSDSWKNYISLYKKTGMALTGDWVFGKRIINSALGATILANEIKKIETLI